MYRRHALRAMTLLWMLISALLVNATSEEPEYVFGTINGQRYRIRDDRQPSLFTADYGDCSGESLINVTRFDAAYYRDNMTVLFHIVGDTALKNESIMMSIGVYAYGESRFSLTFNPCNANIWSACPLQAGTPVEAAGIIPVNQDDVANIPGLALSIPDFEGQAILRIFSNSTQSEIGCFAAQITNGNSFQQKTIVGPILGFFTFVAIVSSFATATYGSDLRTIRKHYAHSLSIQIIFAVWHHIYFTGALSVNWPSVLVAFWSNFAWTGGMIYSEHMQNTINDFIGANKGNTSQVGAAGTGVSNPSLGGGYNIHQIYQRDTSLESLDVEARLLKRDTIDINTAFKYYGQPVKPGLPLPGNYSGFAGTLAKERIPASNAFMTGLLWYLVLVAVVILSIIAFKIVLESLARLKMIKSNHLRYFRSHYLGFTIIAVLRTFVTGFFVVIVLAIFQFSYLASSGPVAIACIVFLCFFVGLGSWAGKACHTRIRSGKYVSASDRLNVEKSRVLKIVPWYNLSLESSLPRSEDKRYAGSVPVWTVRPTLTEKSVHDDEEYTKVFGWLASRYRRTRWWFFIVSLAYEFIRACFIAGASHHPFIQIFGLLVVEILAFVAFIVWRPFEGQRLNIIVGYLFGLSKITTTALSVAFDTRLNLPRIPATIVGVVIIVIQCTLAIAVMLAIVIGAVTSYMSITRDRERIKPDAWNSMRIKYFDRMDASAQDLPKTRSLSPPSVLERPKGPYFRVHEVKRVAKVEDEDEEFQREIRTDPFASQLSLSDPLAVADPLSSRRSRAASIQSHVSYSSLPRAARLHRASWSSIEYRDTLDPKLNRHLSSSSVYSPRIPSRPVSSIDFRRPRSQMSDFGYENRLSRPVSVGANRLSIGVVEFVESTGSHTKRASMQRSWSSPSSRLESMTVKENAPPLPKRSSARMRVGQAELR